MAQALLDDTRSAGASWVPDAVECVTPAMIVRCSYRDITWGPIYPLQHKKGGCDGAKPKAFRGSAAAQHLALYESAQFPEIRLPVRQAGILISGN